MFDGSVPRSRFAVVVGVALPLLVLACSSAVREGGTSRNFMTARVPTRAELVGKWVPKRAPSEPVASKADSSSQQLPKGTMQVRVLSDTLALRADSSIQQPTSLGLMLGRWRFTGDTLTIKWHAMKTSTQEVAVAGMTQRRLTVRLDGNNLLLRDVSDSLPVPEEVYERVDSPTGPTAP